MRNDRDVEKMVSQMGLKHGSRQAVVQYGRGMLAGMHIAYVSVARKMLSMGRSEKEIRLLLSDVTDVDELREILSEAKGNR